MRAMDFSDRLLQLSKRLTEQLDHVDTEEATKNAFILPFISALGYDIFNPTEVVPEFTADVGVKKGEKVDYAIMRSGVPIMLFECKTAGVSLDTAHGSQLYRYFSVTDARFAVLTNGCEYRFFSDLDRANRMDSKPFLVFDIRELDPAVITELKKFGKENFNEDAILESASGLKYVGQLKRFLSEQWKRPNDEFVRFLTSQVYDGRLTANVIEQFRELSSQALHAFVNERLSSRLESALQTEEKRESTLADESLEEPEVVTTSEELQAFYLVQAILREAVPADRIFMRDAKSYCSVLLDDNNRRPICRLWLEGERKYIGLFDREKNVERVRLKDLDDIYAHAERLLETASFWDPSIGITSAEPERGDG